MNVRRSCLKPLPRAMSSPACTRACVVRRLLMFLLAAVIALPGAGRCASAGTIRFEGASDAVKFEDWAIGINSNWVVKSDEDEILIARPYIGLLSYLTPRLSDAFDFSQDDFEFRAKLRGFQPSKHTAYIQLFVVSTGLRFSDPIIVTLEDKVKFGRDGELFQIESYPISLRLRRVGKDLIADADLTGGDSFTTVLGKQGDYFQDHTPIRIAMRISARDNAAVFDSITITGGAGVPDLNVQPELTPATDSAELRPAT